MKKESHILCWSDYMLCWKTVIRPIISFEKCCICLGSSSFLSLVRKSLYMLWTSLTATTVEMPLFKNSNLPPHGEFTKFSIELIYPVVHMWHNVLYLAEPFKRIWHFYRLMKNRLTRIVCFLIVIENKKLNNYVSENWYFENY